MIQKRDVYTKVSEKHPIFVTSYIKTNEYSLESSIHLGVYKMAPEEVQLLVKAAIKFSKLVIL